MPILSDPRHERFAQNLASGMGQADAYAAAGYKRNEGQASRLRKTSQVSARVSELLAPAAAHVQGAVFDAVKALREVAEAGLTAARTAAAEADYRSLVTGSVEALKLAEVLSGGVSDRVESRTTGVLDEIEGRLARFDTEARARQDSPKPH